MEEHKCLRRNEDIIVRDIIQLLGKTYILQRKYCWLHDSFGAIPGNLVFRCTPFSSYCAPPPPSSIVWEKGQEEKEKDREGRMEKLRSRQPSKFRVGYLEPQEVGILKNCKLLIWYSEFLPHREVQFKRKSKTIYCRLRDSGDRPISIILHYQTEVQCGFCIFAELDPKNTKIYKRCNTCNSFAETQRRSSPPHFKMSANLTKTGLSPSSDFINHWYYWNFQDFNHTVVFMTCLFLLK